jgi:malonyl-CoA O-methyltransferase
MPSDLDAKGGPPATLDAAALASWSRRRVQLAEPPWLHTEVARRMAEKSSVIRLEPQRLLDWWGGDEASAPVLRQRYPRAQRQVVEGADAFVARRAPRGAWWRRTLGLAAPEWLPEVEAARVAGSAQLVWSNLALQWQADLPALLQRWHAALAVDGFVMFSCFGPDTLRELRELHARHGWGPVASPFIDMHDIGDALVHAGFADPVMDMEQLRLTWSDAPSLLKELRTLGRNTAPDRGEGLRGRGWRGRLEAAIAAELAGSDGRPALTFEIVYGHAFKPARRATVAAEAQVSLDDMRGMLRAPRPPRP